jgi:epoxyqueuosine reductase
MDLQNIQQLLTDFVLNSRQNIVPDLDEMQIFDPPLVAIAAAADPGWNTLKQREVVGPHHLSPTEWLRGAKSVVSCFLPHTERVRCANRLKGKPATEWLYGRYEGEAFNKALACVLMEAIQRAGGVAMIPSQDGRFEVVNLRSNWSERHVAFLAGLGTFSLNRSLITELGSAGRFMSVITDLKLAPTPRPYTEVDEYCNKCGACIERCPPHAISKEGKDNTVCLTYLREMKIRFAPRYGCGKCQTAIPCEARRPAPPPVKTSPIPQIPG